MRKASIAIVALACLLSACASSNKSLLPNIQIMDTGVFPESIASASNGTVYSGSTKGVIYRALPGSSQATAWITHTEQNGLLSILGVLVDEKSNSLWVCSAPNFFGPELSKGVSSLKAFDLATAKLKGSFDFPEPASVCNDITIEADGAAYASDTTNGRIFRHRPGSSKIELVGADPLLVGIDGLAFTADGKFFVNNVRTNKIYRVALKPDGSMGSLTPIQLNDKLGGPDGMRLLRDNHLILAESGIGRLSIISIVGDKGVMKILREDLESSPGATVVGDTVYVVKSSIKYLLQPDLKGKEPPPAILYAVPLPK